MSFGFSPSDIVTLIALTTKTYKGWRDACGDYSSITGTLNSYQVVLKRVDRHVNKPASDSSASLLDGKDLLLGDLQAVLGSSKHAVSELRSVVKKFSSLGTDRKSNWDRIRMGSKNLDSLRTRLSQDLHLISTLLISEMFETLQLTRHDISNISDNIKGGIPVALENLVEGQAADSKTVNSAWTTHEHDSKEVWRELRREMKKLGFSDGDVAANREALLQFARSITATPDEQEDEPLPTQGHAPEPSSSSDIPGVRPVESNAYQYDDEPVFRSRPMPTRSDSNEAVAGGYQYREYRKRRERRVERSPTPERPYTPPPSPPPRTYFQDPPDHSYDTRQGPTEHQTRARPDQLLIAYKPIALETRDPIYIHMCLPLGWTVIVQAKTLHVSFQDLFAEDDQPMYFESPPMVWPADTIDVPGWRTDKSKFGRLRWSSLSSGSLSYRYSHPSMPSQEAKYRCLTAEHGSTLQDTKHRLEGVQGCFRIRPNGSEWTDFTIERPCQVLEWTHEMEDANPDMLAKVRAWSSLSQPSS